MFGRVVHIIIDKSNWGVFNQNGPNSDKDFNIGADDCPGIFKMDSSGEWIKQ